MRLRSIPFPPGIASGVWVDRASHDLIGYEQNTDPAHQLVIIGHEAWHMFQGHCSSLTAHGAAAARSEESQPPDALAQLVALIAETDGAELSPTTSMDASLHFAARAGAHENEDEVEAELFGYRFATDVQVALTEARTAADPDQLAGRIQASMAHRVRRS
ncbi:toxin-antitoxin system, toxin component [Streptomyces ferrugineus]|uniref:Toxin-antitoxin system, toxin component n=1 Tax=Streptomyces ferrugineus TaxID=1413221 RepID=A0A7M2SWI4_9ACTN|nr:toxin-antitoxin system, toxin component [Streptomyces ferrugineus]QOV40239.1 toxin-antitoxin system, toxin component [Streptomyces ferrugineus]